MLGGRLLQVPFCVRCCVCGIPVFVGYPCLWDTRVCGIPVLVRYPCSWDTRVCGIPVFVGYPCLWDTRAYGDVVGDQMLSFIQEFYSAL